MGREKEELTALAEEDDDFEPLVTKDWIRKVNNEDLGIWCEKDGADLMFRAGFGPHPRSFPVTKKWIKKEVVDNELNAWIKAHVRHGFRWCPRCRKCFETGMGCWCK